MHIMRFGGFRGPGPGFGGGAIFLLLFILFFAAIVFLALSSTHRREGHGHGHGPFSHHGPGHHGPDHHSERSDNPNEARRILDRRFAAGEIDEDEYLRRRKLLEGDI
jgi:putative membrane protein